VCSPLARIKSILSECASLQQQIFVQKKKKTATITTNGHNTPGPVKQIVH
jgi:hypothetical protein